MIDSLPNVEHTEQEKLSRPSLRDYCGLTRAGRCTNRLDRCRDDVWEGAWLHCWRHPDVQRHSVWPEHCGGEPFSPARQAECVDRCARCDCIRTERTTTYRSTEKRSGVANQRSERRWNCDGRGRLPGVECVHAVGWQRQTPGHGVVARRWLCFRVRVGTAYGRYEPCSCG